MGDEEVRQAQQDKATKGAAKQKPAKAQDKGLMAKAKEKIEEVKKQGKEEDKKENKVVLEREYNVPLRKEWLKVPEYKRANKATKALKQFLAQHMKVYDRDLKKIKLDIILNNEIRYRGMKKPPAFIKVKALKMEDGTVVVKLVNIPKYIEFELAREARKKAEQAKKETAPTGVPSEEGKKPAEAVSEKPVEEAKEESNETKEKEKSSKEEMQKLEKTQAKQTKHTTIKKAPIVQRKALKK